MDMITTEAEPQFSQPVRQIALMLMALALVAFGGYLIYPTIQPVVMANPFLNGVIGAVFVVGVIACFWQVFQLVSSVNWIEDFALDGPDNSGGRAPRLLAPLAALMRARGANGQISATSSRSILESVATRVEELRDITRYIVNLLIFLGLLGTFYGLATTVPAVVDTIRSLVPADGDGTLDVSRLLVGLESQMDGMGTAFGSSLLGLAGSLVVGLLELFTSHGQNRFYRELEEWLSGITRVSFAGTDGDGEGMGGPVAGVLDHMAEQMDEMRKMFIQSDAKRVGLEEKMGNVAESVYLLASNMDGGEDGAMARVAEGQDKLVKLLQVQAESGGADAETRMRMRSIDTQLLHILEEMAAGRQESIGDIRADLAALIKATRTGGRAEPRTSDITDGTDDQWR